MRYQTNTMKEIDKNIIAINYSEHNKDNSAKMKSMLFDEVKSLIEQNTECSFYIALMLP